MQEKVRRTAPRITLVVALVLVVVVGIGAFVLGNLLSDDGDGGDGDSGAVVRDLATILDGDIDVEVHGDGTATVLLDTIIEVVCAVAYGTTGEFGAIATDDDMAGGGHANHHPLLAGLEANTQYFYRLQGVGADGTLYTSEVRSFMTGSFEAAGSGSNLALAGTVAEVSSEFSSSFGGASAIDGNPATQWSSSGDGDDAYIVIDLGVSADLVGVGFRTREMSDGSSITTAFTVSVDGGPSLGPFDAGPGLAVGDFTGGKFTYQECPPSQVQAKAILYDGTKEHGSLDFSGDRGSVILFAHSAWH